MEEKIERTDTNEKGFYYRVSFFKPGCSYGSCFTDEAERNKFADSMKQAGFKVTFYNS